MFIITMWFVGYRWRCCGSGRIGCGRTWFRMTCCGSRECGCRKICYYTFFMVCMRTWYGGKNWFKNITATSSGFSGTTRKIFSSRYNVVKFRLRINSMARRVILFRLSC